MHGRILGPGMPGILAAHVLPDIGIGARPESGQVELCLHWALAGRQKRDTQRQAPGPPARQPDGNCPPTCGRSTGRGCRSGRTSAAHPPCG